jgi:protein-disulfide isomerase
MTDVRAELLHPTLVGYNHGVKLIKISTHLKILSKQNLLGQSHNLFSEFGSKQNRRGIESMSKRAKSRRSAKKQTNWVLIAGIVVGGIVIFVGLIALAFREPNRLSLLGFCNNNPENCIVLGNAEADVAVVEVSDYGCSHCRDFNLETSPQLAVQYVDTNQVKWIVVPFALQNQTGAFPTMPSTIAAMCANEQGAFADYHESLFELQSTPLFNTQEGFMQVATALDLDVEAFSSCLNDNAYADRVLENITMAQQAGINATPSFFIDGDLLAGDQPLSVFQQRLDALLDS